MEHESPLSISKAPFSKAAAIKFVVLIGLVSLFADMTYEGARSINGPYLAILGAGAAVVGIVSGLGELIGYSVRLVSGHLSDRTGKYWTITLLGYLLNLGAVPLLALAGHWELAAFLMIIERLGKGIRTPARDAMLSHATQATGRGWGFGLHEAMDQIGAVTGPLILAGIFYARGGYQIGYAVLVLPALFALGVLLVGWRLYPRPQDLEVATPELKPAGLPFPFWIYLAAVALVAAGYVDFPLVAYHFEKTAVVPQTWIPLFYAVAMSVDALAALLFGRLFDRIGITVLMFVALLSAFFAPLAFLGDFALALVGIVLWGIGVGAQESIMRAAVAGMVAPNRRGSAYGIFNAGYGVFWFLGSALMGILYDVSLPALIAFSVTVQLASIPLFFWVGKRLRPADHA